MKNVFWKVLAICISIQLAGCTPWHVRTSTSTRPRVDQEIAGNRGYIFGQPSSSPKEPTFTERKVYKIEVEVPSKLFKEIPKSTKEITAPPTPKEDKTLWGNRGYIKRKASDETLLEMEKPEFIEEEVPIEEKEKVEEIEFEETSVSEIKEEIIPAPREVTKTSVAEKIAEVHTYKVKKGDSLQKISNEFYGTTKKWNLLYNANKTKLKNPDSIFPGQVLIIPEID